MNVPVALVDDVELGETLVKRVDAADRLDEEVIVTMPVLRPDGKGEKVVVAVSESGRLARDVTEDEAEDVGA